MGRAMMLNMLHADLLSASILTLKVPTKIAADNILFFFLLLCFKGKKRLDVSCESYQVLFSLKNNEKVFVNVVCCIRDCLFKG